jgi:hypothetical protein
MQPPDDQATRMPKVFVRPTESWAVYQARLLHLLEEAGVRPREGTTFQRTPGDGEATAARPGASGLP